MLAAHLDRYLIARLLLQRGLAAVYLVAFVSALHQFPALLGENGLLPVPQFVKEVSFRRAPSLFHWRYSDRLFSVLAWSGIGLSVAALSGVSERFGVALSVAVWLLLWCAYLSIVNVGQTFYAFGWESMLLEAGFFACFLGPADMEPSLIPVLALRWMLFRTELGAGLIKWRHDPCWRDLTCLYYHHETQPLPNPLSWYAHRLPKWAHRAGVAFSHLVQLIVPFALLAPQPWSSAAGLLIIAHQLLLIATGNYAWLNWLTVVLAFASFGDRELRLVFSLAEPGLTPRPVAFQLVLYALAAATLALSVQPVLNFFSKRQRMNYCYNPLHLVNVYGAFGAITRERYEVVLEGAADEEGERWVEYSFKAKPGDPMRKPLQIAPYHLRLDWLMWFLPLGSQDPQWFIRLVERLLEGDRQVLRLFRRNPFPDAPPRWIRASLYAYRYTTREERAATGAWWKREQVGMYLAPVRLPRRSSRPP